MPIFAQFDYDFPDDPKVIEAGHLAEHAYMRCVLRGRSSLCDGIIHRSRIARWLVGIPGKPEKHMQTLVDTGLLLVHPDGWAFPEHIPFKLIGANPHSIIRSQAKRIRRSLKTPTTCPKCGKSDRPMHLDHVIPVSRGGTNATENLQWLCAPCNLRKGARV